MKTPLKSRAEMIGSACLHVVTPQVWNKGKGLLRWRVKACLKRKKRGEGSADSLLFIRRGKEAWAEIE